MPFGPVADTASGGELSRVALALAVVAGGETLVFDEIDAGIGGVTAHRVAETLSRLALRAQVITITHLPQIANVGDASFPRREGARRPHSDGDRGALRCRAPDGARANAWRRGVPDRDRRPSPGNDRGRRHGPARPADEGSRQAAPPRRPRDHRRRRPRSRLGRGARRSGRASGCHVSPSSSGRFPNPGPLELVRAGVCLVDASPGVDLFDEVVDGETVTVRAGGFSGGTERDSPTASSSRSARSSARSPTSRVASRRRSRRSADNTLRHLRDEGKLLADGIDFPPLQTRFRDRHAVVVARGPGYKSDLRIVRPYIRNFKPVLVAVDGGADALLEIGLKPHVIVGDFDSVLDAALKTGAELLVHAYSDGRAPGSERLHCARARVLDLYRLRGSAKTSPSSWRTSAGPS